MMPKLLTGDDDDVDDDDGDGGETMETTSRKFCYRSYNLHPMNGLSTASSWIVSRKD